ncbi:hypothetical protein FLONG3_4448 [Fusarium longipes]|uniref:DUF7704 domain-containing protein n=1 Tax=Fusarium longipes TaxID=694270 RepID=A0A395SY93_9HYPO|nr:hypothetical protein FLONG3_4448 [Fusarium longipes]
MASSLPTFPRIVFTIFEPISLVAGFVGAVIDPAWFINEQVPQSNVMSPSGNGIMVTWQLGNLYLLLGFLGIAILSTTNEISVVRAYLIALWLGDIGHVGFSSYGLGWDMLMNPTKWNATTWGNIAVTLQRVMRNTRRNGPAPVATPPREARAPQVEPPASVKPSRVLQTDPVARRNAPPWARRESSISTNPARLDDETEYLDEDDDDDDGDDFSQPDVPISEPEVVKIPREDLQPSQEFDPETLKNLEILEHMVPDLARAADSLYKYSKQKPSNNEVFQRCLRIKRRAFYSIKDDFKELGQPCKGDFVDFTSFLELGSTQEQEVLVAQIARANIVMAYDRVLDFEDDQTPEIFTFLKTFNQIFPDYFLLRSEVFQNPEVILDMRVWLFVETLSHTHGQGDIKELLVEFFCDPQKITTLVSVEEQSNYAALLSGQYFREVGGSARVDTSELCTTRIREVVEVFNTYKHDRHKAIAQLMEKYPLGKLLKDLQLSFDGMYILAYEATVGADTQSPRPDQQAIVESQSDHYGSDSQSIIRAGTQEVERSLFVNKRSLLALENGTQASGGLTFSNQQPVGPISRVPRDYHQHTNADLLNSPFPPASSFRLVSNSGKSQHRGHKRPRDATAEDDEEDSFETDNRRLDLKRREELKRQMPPPPKPELTHRSIPRRVPVPSSARSMPPAFDRESSRDSTPRAVPQPPSSSVVSYDALKKAASQRHREARLADPERQGPRQRVSWSDHDTQLLLDFIQEHGARWSTIENIGKDHFEHPRNQQAYRDRARNLKTEILIADALLPPNFNDVALGNKEIVKVKTVGKNPYRKEEDIDANGNPINTELA